VACLEPQVTVEQLGSSTRTKNTKRVGMSLAKGHSHFVFVSSTKPENFNVVSQAALRASSCEVYIATYHPETPTSELQHVSF
jgi:hypothetical protein